MNHAAPVLVQRRDHATRHVPRQIQYLIETVGGGNERHVPGAARLYCNNFPLICRAIGCDTILDQARRVTGGKDDFAGFKRLTAILELLLARVIRATSVSTHESSSQHPDCLIRTICYPN